MSNMAILPKETVSSARDTSYNAHLQTSLAVFYPTVFTQTHSDDFLPVSSHHSEKLVEENVDVVSKSSEKLMEEKQPSKISVEKVTISEPHSEAILPTPEVPRTPSPAVIKPSLLSLKQKMSGFSVSPNESDIVIPEIPLTATRKPRHSVQVQQRRPSTCPHVPPPITPVIPQPPSKQRRKSVPQAVVNLSPLIIKRASVAPQKPIGPQVMNPQPARLSLAPDPKPRSSLAAPNRSSLAQQNRLSMAIPSPANQSARQSMIAPVRYILPKKTGSYESADQLKLSNKKTVDEKLKKLQETRKLQSESLLKKRSIYSDESDYTEIANEDLNCDTESDNGSYANNAHMEAASKETIKSRDSPPNLADFFDSSDATLLSALSELDKSPSMSQSPSLEKEIQKVTKNLEKFRHPERQVAKPTLGLSLQKLASTLEDTLQDRKNNTEKTVELQEESSSDGSESALSEESDELVRCCRFRKRKPQPDNKKLSTEFSLFRRNPQSNTKVSVIRDTSEDSEESEKIHFTRETSIIEPESDDDYFSFGMVLSSSKQNVIKFSKRPRSTKNETQSVTRLSDNMSIVQSLQDLHEEVRR